LVKTEAGVFVFFPGNDSATMPVGDALVDDKHGFGCHHSGLKQIQGLSCPSHPNPP
jgi:hypothetical protein